MIRSTPRKISLLREKGAAFLSLVLVMALVSGMLSLGSAKMSQVAMNANGSSSIAMQAGAYASGKAEILKKEDYSDLKNQGKTPIANSNEFYDEVSVGVESVYDAEKNIKQKECQIRVYHKDDSLPRSTIKLMRYSVESTATSVPQGSIIPWYGSIGNIPNGFALCDGKNGTPDLRDRFLVGAGYSYTLGNMGGENFHQLTVAEMPSHQHSTSNIFSSFGFDVNGSGTTGPMHVIDTGDNRSYADWYPPAITGVTGGNQPHENRPPYYALYYLMKL